MKRLVLLLALAATLSVSAQQDLARFSGLRSEGPIPADLRKNLDQLYAEDKQRVRDYNDGRLTNSDRVLKQSYFINRLVTNGRILYGDPITTMVEKIADTLLVDYPDLRKELRFYSLKSAKANAFTTGQGMIFVNLGLVAKCETEAQLAYVISHEIVHYYRQHNTEELVRKKSGYKDRDAQLADFLRRHNRSFEMEHEADSLGLALFYLNSPYYKQVADGVFDVLLFADLPFDEMVVDTNLFNTPYYRLPSQYFVTKVGDISADEDYDDSQSTHPNIAKRRARTNEMLKGLSGGSPFVTVSQQEFLHLRDLARLECIRQQLIYNEPIEAYYNSMVMLRDQPDNTFLLGAQAQSLYTLARTKCVGAGVDDTEKHQGEIHQLYNLFNHLSPSEACLIALHKGWAIHKTLPEETYILDLCRSLAGTIHDECHHELGDFSDSYDTLSATIQQPQATGKYAHIRRKTSSGSTNPVRYAFTDLLQSDPEFAAFLEGSLVAQRNDTAVAEGKLLLFDPYYGVYDRENESFDYRRSYSLEEDLVGYVPQVAEGLGIDIVDFSDPALRSHDDDRFYNDFVTLVEWTTDYLSKEKFANNRLYTQPGMDEMSARYGAHLLSINNVFNIEYPGRFYKHEGTYTHNRVIDTRNAQTLKARAGTFAHKDSRNLVGNEVYTTLARAFGYQKGPSGYFGHRMSLSVGAAVDFPLLNEPFERYSQRRIDLHPELSLQYVVKEFGALSLTLDYNPTQFDCKSEVSILKADILNLGITYRFYRNASAPMGFYLGFGALGCRVALQPVDEGKTLKYLNPTYYRGGILVETGRNWMIGKSLFVNFGARYGLPIANFSEVPGYETYHPRENAGEVNSRRMMNANLAISNILVFHLNLGFMPF